MISRIFLGIRIALRQAFHEGLSTLCLCMAIAAVILPVLLMFGLKNGVIRSKLEALRKDPNTLMLMPLGRLDSQIHWSEDYLESLARIPSIRFIVPQTDRVFNLCGYMESESFQVQAFTTEYTTSFQITVEGDPHLVYSGCSCPGNNEAVLNSALAEKLNVQVGDTVSVKLRSSLGERVVPLKVSGILRKDYVSSEGVRNTYACINKALADAIMDYNTGTISGVFSDAANRQNIPVPEYDGVFLPMAECGLAPLLTDFPEFEKFTQRLASAEEGDLPQLASFVRSKGVIADAAEQKRLDERISQMGGHCRAWKWVRRLGGVYGKDSTLVYMYSPYRDLWLTDELQKHAQDGRCTVYLPADDTGHESCQPCRKAVEELNQLHVALQNARQEVSGAVEKYSGTVAGIQAEQETAKATLEDQQSALNAKKSELDAATRKLEAAQKRLEKLKPNKNRRAEVDPGLAPVAVLIPMSFTVLVTGEDAYGLTQKLSAPRNAAPPAPKPAPTPAGNAKNPPSGNGAASAQANGKTDNQKAQKDKDKQATDEAARKKKAEEERKKQEEARKKAAELRKKQEEAESAVAEAQAEVDAVQKEYDPLVERVAELKKKIEECDDSRKEAHDSLKNTLKGISGALQEAIRAAETACKKAGRELDAKPFLKDVQRIADLAGDTGSLAGGVSAELREWLGKAPAVQFPFSLDDLYPLAGTEYTWLRISSPGSSINGEVYAVVESRAGLPVQGSEMLVAPEDLGRLAYCAGKYRWDYTRPEERQLVRLGRQYKFFAYAKDLETVGEAAQELGSRGIRCASSAGEIEKTKKLDHHLSLLLMVLSVLSGAGGMVALVLNLVNSTEKRRKDYALLRTIGMGRISMALMPIYESLFVMVCTLALSFGAYFALHHLLNNLAGELLEDQETVCYMPVQHVAAIILVCLALAVFAAFLSSFRLSRLSPAQYLREM